MMLCLRIEELERHEIDILEKVQLKIETYE